MSSEGVEQSSTRSVEILAWLEVNKRRIATGLVVVGILVAAVAIYRWHRSQREQAGSAALLKVQVAASMPGAKPASAGEYARVAGEYADTLAGKRALLFAGEALFHEGRYPEAQAEFAKAASALSGHSLEGLAAFGVAASLDAAGKLDEAKAAYEDLTLRFAGTSVASQARLVLGGLLEKRGEPRQALQAYNQLTNAMMSVWATEAQLRREALLSRHPELVPTNAPAPAVTLPAS